MSKILPPLPTSMTDHRANIDATIVRDLPPPTKTSYPPDFCDSSLTVNPLKIIIANLGVFDVASISSLFVDFSQIALHPFVVYRTTPHSFRVFPTNVEHF